MGGCRDAACRSGRLARSSRRLVDSCNLGAELFAWALGTRAIVGEDPDHRTHLGVADAKRDLHHAVVCDRWRRQEEEGNRKSWASVLDNRLAVPDAVGTVLLVHETVVALIAPHAHLPDLEGEAARMRRKAACQAQRHRGWRRRGQMQ